MLFAKECGMQYIVLTSKQHEGFALFRSEADSFNCYDSSPFKRDIVGELAEACKKYGMKLGLYYSQVKEILTKYGDLVLIRFDTPKTISPEESEELYETVKALQPNCLVNPRLGNGKYDYVALGDNEIPDSLDTAKSTDNNAMDGINYLINVGPDHLGRIPVPSMEILKKVKEMEDAGL